MVIIVYLYRNNIQNIIKKKQKTWPVFLKQVIHYSFDGQYVVVI